MAARASRRDVGFALVEALASLVILGLISLMVLLGLGTGRRVWDRIDAREASAEAIDSAQASLRARIEQVFPATSFLNNPPVIDFDGKADKLDFLANPTQAGRPAPLRRYTLRLTAGGDLLLASANDVAGELAPPDQTQVLLTGVRGIDIAYFGAWDFDSDRRWRPSWHQQTALPLAVRVRLTFEPGDRRAWPDLIIHPAANIDAACVFNPTTHRCMGRA